MPIQMIFTNGMMKKIDFSALEGEGFTETAERLAEDIQAMTGAYVQPVNCQQINLCNKME